MFVKLTLIRLVIIFFMRFFFRFWVVAFYLKLMLSSKIKLIKLTKFHQSHSLVKLQLKLRNFNMARKEVD